MSIITVKNESSGSFHDKETMMRDFHGVKMALFDQGKLITLLRDNIPNIPWPNYWDFPGGGREENENPRECALRELYEELNVVLPAEAIIWEQRFLHPHHADAVFLVAKLPPPLRSQLKLGDEGQSFGWMTPTEYFAHPLAIPYLCDRLKLYFDLHDQEYN